MIAGDVSSHGTTTSSSNGEVRGGLLERKLKVDFLGKTEKVNLPKNGMGDCLADQVSGRSVSSMEDRKSITDNRCCINLNRTFFCPTYGGKIRYKCLRR